MKMVRKFMLLSAMAALLVLAACGQANSSNSGAVPASSDSASEPAKEGPLKIVTSFTILEDFAREIGGEDVEVHNLVPTGTDPHEYEPLPEDIKKATDADVLFYNGLNLEGGKSGWFFKMIESVGQKEENVFNLTERVEPMYIGGKDGHEEEINPHAFIDPAVGIKMAEDMRDALMKKDPARKENYEKRADEYISKLKEIDKEYEEKINSIPEENRILVTSERAFQYMTTHYGLKEAYIWEIDTEENGSPTQIKSLVEFIKEHKVPVLFIESNVDPRPMETVANETGVRIAEKRIYSDEIGQRGAEVDTYIKYLEYNLELIHSELSKSS
ncbi:zinc ABC transporter substrate-binding protein [Paenibacillus melissococcoides]|uniref:Zinc ABC transporter substrate-binding protein n=1 Tax=Paenibacillus melissococcoides TaxID=2912268 RepID=A0ABM9G8I4_9BACL|nr:MULTISPECIES: zinc ABC transporter substrate-binding protein [Paenibacillus]MEB9894554.1 zinc ABC transporter substrate-binding protein [Bacillus cereus]CAH8248308.1 zinc ABC transporter substrate-binding protein [Paenibacillus melissococcoides]CAH8717870.1 zinc ABC transporter substrate-binding protein [Paenibacillus melissococcoides]CAH8719253.1 zinc ABC transporter substrate-binding protein [Paenibacillus melissococcoides]GIO80320.1 manganese-binding lipoprotein MntA [Paenibacillus dendr